MIARATLRLIFCFILINTLASATEAATLYLPRQLSAADMQTTGVALVNPTASSATATFRLWSSSGASLGSAQRTVPARGQISALVSQLFPNNTAGASLSIDTGADRLHGFWLGGDFVTSTDGAQFLTADDAGAYPVFPYILRGSEISFMNIGTARVTGEVLLFDDDGDEINSANFDLAPMATFQREVATLFSAQRNLLNSAPYWVQVSASSSTAKIIGTTVTQNAVGVDNAVTNASYWLSQDLTFPHFVEGPIGGSIYSTTLILSNAQDVTQNVRITLNRESGTPITVQRRMQPFELIRETVPELFGISSADGWLKVEPEDYIGAWASYADLVGGGLTVIEGQLDGDTALILGHIADLNPWWTGIALANPSTSVAAVEIYAINPGGTLIGGPTQSPVARFTLAAGTKRAFLLGDLIPQTQSRTSDGGFIHARTTNGVPIFGLEIFFLRSGRVFANVPAIRLDGLVFPPPQ